MKIKLIAVGTFVLMLSAFLFCDTAGYGNRELKVFDSLGRIGFIHEFSPEGTNPMDEIVIGIEVKENVLYKLTTVDEQIYISAGMLSNGVNSISIPVNLITGQNKGVFNLYFKVGKVIGCRQVVLVPEKYDIIDKPVEDGSEETVNDNYTHEVIVSGNSNSGIDMHNRIMLDTVSGDYPGLNQGIPILPVLYLLGNKIYHSLKKKKKKIFPLYSQSEVYIEKGEKNGKYAHLSLRIHIIEM